MALLTYDDLQARVANYLKGRTDLTDRIEEFILLGEKRLFRRLRVEEMISTATVVASALIDLPSDFLEIDLAVYQSDPSVQLKAIDKRTAAFTYNASYTGEPTHYRVRNGKMLLYPAAEASTNIDLEYYAKPPAVSEESDQDIAALLFTEYTDLYLYSALLEAAPYLYDDARINTWKGLLDEGISDANNQASRQRLNNGVARPGYGAGG